MKKVSGVVALLVLSTFSNSGLYGGEIVREDEIHIEKDLAGVKASGFSNSHVSLTAVKRESLIGTWKAEAEGLDALVIVADNGQFSGLVKQGETCLLYTSPSPRDS